MKKIQTRYFESAVLEPWRLLIL